MKKFIIIFVVVAICAAGIFAFIYKEDIMTIFGNDNDSTTSENTTLPPVTDSTTVPPIADSTTDVPAVCNHVLVKIPAVNASCTKTGLTEGQKCVLCNKIIVEQKETPLAPHNETKLPRIEATCTKTGLTEGSKCSTCDKIILQQQEISLKPHSEQIIPAVNATCLKTGLTEGKKCSVCNKILLEQTETSLAAHTEQIIPAVGPSCTESGLSEGKKCSVCDKILVEQTMVDVIDHIYNDSTQKCKSCGKDSGYSAGLFYKAIENGEAYSVKDEGLCEDETIIIPPTYNGKPVKEIESAAFRYGDTKHIIIPDSVISIGTNAFASSSIESVTFGKGVETVGDKAFYMCDQLETVTFLGGTKIIGREAFYSCYNLKNIYLKDGLETISYKAFWYCEDLEKIIITQSVSTIENRAFQGCESLTIYCEAQSKPSGWISTDMGNWNPSNCPVVWGYSEN